MIKIVTNENDKRSLAKSLREKVVRRDQEQCLVALLPGTSESRDGYTILNCSGIGRIRRFENYSLHCGYNDAFFAQRARSVLAPGFNRYPVVTAQVFQIAACTWRCWYCYVDYGLLSGDERRGRFVSADELVAFYLAHSSRANFIDLSGGQADLVPEWPLWVLRALERSDETSCLVRSEDNLSNEWLWEFLTASELEYLARHPNYVRIGCLKGFDPISFAYNTRDRPENFSIQFDIVRRLLETGFNIYLHATFTGTDPTTVRDSMLRLLDSLQVIHPRLPLRVMPLRIRETPAIEERNGRSLTSLVSTTQSFAFECWHRELRERFTSADLQTPIGDVRL